MNAKRIVLPLIVFALLVVAWDVIIRVNDIQPYVLPGPGLVAQTLIADWSILSSSLLVTLTTALEGFIAAERQMSAEGKSLVHSPALLPNLEYFGRSVYGGYRLELQGGLAELNKVGHVDVYVYYLTPATNAAENDETRIVIFCDEPFQQLGQVFSGPAVVQPARAGV